MTYRRYKDNRKFTDDEIRAKFKEKIAACGTSGLDTITRIACELFLRCNKLRKENERLREELVKERVRKAMANEKV